MEVVEIEELFEALGEVVVRNMFGGKGVYRQGLIVAVEIGGEMRLKADEESAPLFAAAGARQWTYEGKRGLARLPYWSIPEAALDDPDETAVWTRLAFEAALRAERKKAAKGGRRGRSRPRPNLGDQ